MIKTMINLENQRYATSNWLNNGKDVKVLVGTQDELFLGRCIGLSLNSKIGYAILSGKEWTEQTRA